MRWSRLQPRPLLVTVTLAGLLAASGCSSTEQAEPARDRATFEVAGAAQLEAGAQVPAPTGPVVLTLRGVPNTNVGRTLQFDLATLDSIGTVSYRVFDRQAEGRDVRFSGPLLRDVLEVAGADPDARTLHCVALNDYAVDVPASDADELPVILATRADGRRMTVAHYGPTRLIYPTVGYSLDRTVYDPRWIWQLRSIRVT